MTQPSEQPRTAALLIPLGQANWLRFDPLDDEGIAAIVARLDADYAKADLAGRYAQAWLDVARLVSTMAAYAAILNLQLPGAEAAAPDPSPAPLDVERLEGALIAVREHANFPKRWVPDDYRWLARQLAAEYARPGQP